MNLRDYQQNCKQQIEANWEKGVRRQVAVLPTGAGKTVLFSALANDFTSKGEGVLVVAHREELITQAAGKLAQSTGLQPGIIKAGYKPTSESLIQVASIQSLMRRKNYPKASLVIIDECHHAAANTYRELINQYPEAKILGVTATPCRIDGYGFHELFEDLIVGVTPRQLIAEGYLCPYKLFGGFAKLGLYTPKGRDFTAKELEKAATKIKPEDVVDCWHQFCKGRKTIIFAVNVAHSKLITARFNQFGVSAEHLDGNTSPTERQAILERFRTGQTLILSNCGILTEGFDCPNVEAVQCARPTTSVSLWLQMLGRALRPSDGKEYAVFVDQTDNWARLGKPDDDREWSLAPVSADEESPGVRSCDHCHHVFKPMEALVKTKVVFDKVKGVFKTLLTILCPNCGKNVTWRVPSGSSREEGDSKEEPIDVNVEFKEIPPECSFSILEKIGGIRKMGSRFKNLENRSQRFYDELCELIRSQNDINLSELKVAVDVLDLKSPPDKILDHALGLKLRRYAFSKEWHSIEQLMGNRPMDVKRLVWQQLTPAQQQQIRDLKARTVF